MAQRKYLLSNNMIIQIWHSRKSEYQKELYEPIKKASFFREHTFIFPHDGVNIDSRKSLKTVDLFIVEVSHPSTGLGIEIGLASSYGKRILCVSKKWSQISSSLSLVTEDYIEYDEIDYMVHQIGLFIEKIRRRIPKIYVWCALTHATLEFRQQISDFKNSLRERFEILDFVGVTDGWTISPQEIYAHDRNCVLDADILVAECSYPSTGLGYEIATAIDHGKKVILIAHQDALVTRMILGIPHDKAAVMRYRNINEVRDFIFLNS